MTVQCCVCRAQFPVAPEDDFRTCPSCGTRLHVTVQHQPPSEQKRVERCAYCGNSREQGCNCGAKDYA